jgi:CRP-like cAMP-binding protein/Zn-dependent protease
VGDSDADVYELVARRLDVMQGRPCRRQGLRSALREDGLVLNNPVLKTYALLEPADAWLWERMDGAQNVGDLLMAYFQEFRVLAPVRVLQLVAMLKSRGMLTDDPVDVWASVAERLRSRSSRLLGSALGVVTGRVSLRLRRADGFFGWLCRFVGRVVYPRPVRWLSLAVVIAGGIAFLFELLSGRPGSTAVSAPVWGVLLIVYGVELAITAAHELAHGIECKHRDCRVNAFGVTIFYGVPCPFVDTTDVWMSDRRGRIATSWAGPYSELVFSGVLALMLLFLVSPWQAILFQVVFLIYFTAVFNLLPFVEMDGYYMLVDWLRIPKLRARSFAFLRRGLLPRWRARKPLSRLEVIYLWYGIGSLVGTVVFSLLGLRYWYRQAERFLGPVWGRDVAARVAIVAFVALLLLPLLLHAARGAALGQRTRRARLWFRQRLPSATADARLLMGAGIVVDGDERAAKETLGLMQRRSYRPGALVIQEGEAATEFFVVRRGEAVVIEGGDEIEGARLAAGDYFGELALVEHAPRSASVRALTRLDVLVMRKGDFDRLVADHVELTAAVDRMITAEGLARFPALAPLAPTQLRELRSHLTRSAVASGETIFSEGEPGDRYYLIDEGRVGVVQGQQRLRILGPGESFGEIALLDDRPRTATVRALTPVTVYSMDRSGFDRFVRAIVARRGGFAWTAGSANVQP